MPITNKDLEYMIQKEKDNKKQLAETLYQKIKEVGISNSANKCNVHQTDFSAWMNGRRNWSLEKMARIYKALK